MVPPTPRPPHTLETLPACRSVLPAQLSHGDPICCFPASPPLVCLTPQRSAPRAEQTRQGAYPQRQKPPSTATEQKATSDEKETGSGHILKPWLRACIPACPPGERVSNRLHKHTLNAPREHA